MSTFTDQYDELLKQDYANGKRIAELEAQLTEACEDRDENFKAVLNITKIGTDVADNLRSQNQRYRERMEYMRLYMRIDTQLVRAKTKIGGWFDKDGKALEAAVKFGPQCLEVKAK